MRKYFGVLAVVVLSAATLPLLAQDTALNGSMVRNATYYDAVTNHGRLEKFSSFTGKDITGSEDKKVGKVKDFAVDLENGRIVEVVVATGGMMGVDRKYIAVPPPLFHCTPDVKTLHLRLNQQELKDAPAFDLAHWPQTFEKTNLLENYARYQVQPYFAFDTNMTEVLSPREVEKRRSAPTPMERIGYIERGTTILGLSVTNWLGEKLGKVENLIVDLPAGRVVAVVISSGGFLGIGDELSAVPPSSFNYNDSHDALQLNMDKEAMTHAPHFSASHWPDVNQSNYIANLYGAYQTRSYPGSTNADRNFRNDKDNDALTPMDQGTSQADIETTREIRKQIVARKDLSVSAHNIKVITLNGRVTLRGQVNSEAEKRTLIEIARNVASTGPALNNQIEVKPADSANSAE